ncbi:unnamed protein product [Blepharisma stoltei]|uniref:Integrase catalytic domain-containing protein n=1 Tax=Blepharisma stoltei TaxID=1481888 RepID=A0AAU9JFG4_9CILI|nr:unnamed protein product [Blepharisma stoltei]
MDQYFNLDLAIDYFMTYYNKQKVHKTTGFRPEILFFETNEQVFLSVVENVKKKKHEREIEKFNQKIENNGIYFMDYLTNQSEFKMEKYFIEELQA